MSHEEIDSDGSEIVGTSDNIPIVAEEEQVSSSVVVEQTNGEHSVEDAKADVDEFNGEETNGVIHDEVKEEEDDDDDDDFGSFDDASFDEPQQVESFESNTTMVSEPVHTKSILSTTFPESTFQDESLFLSKLDTVLDTVFSDDSTKFQHDQKDINKESKLLSDRSEIIFNQLSTMPHLRPSNWIRSNIRHNLLIKLGIPINLDEISNAPPRINDSTNTIHSGLSKEGSSNMIDSSNIGVNPTHNRRKSISAKDIHWDQFNIPQFSSLNITNEEKQQRLQQTNEILSRIETDNLDHSSRQFLESQGGGGDNKQSSPDGSMTTNEEDGDQFIQTKLQQLRSNYQQLQELASCWIENSNELHKDFEIYENVVQNLIGYSQKLRRDEIFENLKKVKSKKKTTSKRKLWK
ncbi:hypothetical protein DFJ63DRAFT_311574 [Scheffersomyces coipomensis]|uniref:uncharacterized protein n=1 Tax=Scheffersomyces coipomensis TaxID=1788519 RepID=UPI00315CABB9